MYAYILNRCMYKIYTYTSMTQFYLYLESTPSKLIFLLPYYQSFNIQWLSSYHPICTTIALKLSDRTQYKPMALSCGCSDSVHQLYQIDLDWLNSNWFNWWIARAWNPGGQFCSSMVLVISLPLLMQSSLLVWFNYLVVWLVGYLLTFIEDMISSHFAMCGTQTHGPNT